MDSASPFSHISPQASVDSEQGGLAWYWDRFEPAGSLNSLFIWKGRSDCLVLRVGHSVATFG